MLRELAAERLGPAAPADPVATNVLVPEAYAALLDGLGFTRQHVRLQVYPHRLASAAEVVEWMKGTSLTRFRRALEPPAYEAFVEEYRSRLVPRPPRRPSLPLRLQADPDLGAAPGVADSAGPIRIRLLLIAIRRAGLIRPFGILIRP